MTQPPVVLLVGKGPPELGGIPSFLVSLIESDLSARFVLRFRNLTPSSGSQGGRLSWRNAVHTIADAWHVLADARGADVVHLHSALFPTVTLLRAGVIAAAARAAGAPVLVHAHGGRLDQWLTTPWRRRVARLALTPATSIVAVSQPNQHRLAAATGRTVELLLNGIDTRRFRPADEAPSGRPPRVLYAGVLARRKGLFELFDASRALAAEGIEHELVLAGGPAADGHDEVEELRAAAPDGVRFLGTLDSDGVALAYREADVFCLPSWGDAMPMCVLEAMSSGLPVVATDVGQIAQMVVDRETGRLVRPRDVDGLTAALRDLLVDPDTRRRAGAAGRRRVEGSFDVQATVEALTTSYRMLAPRRRAGRRHRLSRPWSA